MTSTRRPRLRDVAELAGVSEKTVSNVLNDYPHITEHTRNKVESALTELNYRVNLSARSLASGRTGFIALAVPSIDNPYFARLAGHVIEAAAEYRWTVLIEQTGGANSSESQVIAGTTRHFVDGIILHPETLQEADLLIRDDKTPLVLTVERPEQHVADNVVADNVAAARELTQHLISTGRRRIALVGIGPTRLIAGAMRFEGYSSALRDAGLPLGPVLSVEHDDRRSGAEIVPALLAEEPDAVICFNDVLAAGVLHGLLAAGIEVPRQIALAGFDALDETAFMTPPLTSVRWDTRELARRAVELLADRATGSEQPPREVTVGYELIVRASTDPAHD